jgi:murein DD-endopeptidase MepM/ murein hydrolase activator NlpD
MSEYAPLARSLALAALALSGAVAAFATIAPSAEPAPPPRSAIVEPIALRAAGSLLPAPASYLHEERFQRGDTLAGLFERLGVSQTDAQSLIRAPALRQLRPGQAVRGEVGARGELLRLSYLSGRDRITELRRAGEGFRARELAAPLQREVLMRAGVIQSSLFGAADAAGIPDAVAIQVADIFAGDVDFHRELRRGDRFAVVYEQHALEGVPVHSGRVLVAEFVNQGRVLRAVLFAPERGGAGYYAPDGSNLRKAFLRSPLEYSRISSGFGMRRHPFLRSWRAHAGIDYAAPAGTKVRAAGDGVVEFAGHRGGYGNMLILRHRGQYSTLYAHLSRLAPGLSQGARVAQGDAIGYVGQTGWATGDHLHYEFRIGGQARNPYAVAMPAGQPVPESERDAFHAHAAPLVARIELLAAQPVAMLE